MFRLLLIPFLCLFSFGFGQTQKISFSVFSSEEECASIQKEMFLFRQVNGKDSLIIKDTFKLCTIEKSIPKLKGTYQLVVRAKKYEELVAFFEITDNTPEVADLKILELKRKSNQLDEVTISGIKRSFIQVDADKTTIMVKDNAVLTVSSVYDAILKIPGILPYPGGGFVVGGKFASVFFEGLPSNLSGDDLMNLLRSLPATSVETIEIISNPGASYDANVSGAIINIISLSKVGKWISGTATLNYGLNANNKILPSLVISGKSKKLNWQLQTGYSYFERTTESSYARNFTSFDNLTQLNSRKEDKSINGLYYFKPSLNYKINSHSSILANYNGSFNQGNRKGISISSSDGISPPVVFSNEYDTEYTGLNNEVFVKYQNRFDTLKRVVSVTAFYSNYSRNQLNKTIQNQADVNQYSLLKNNLKLNRFYIKSDVEIPFKKIQLYIQTGVKYSTLLASSFGEYNLQNPSEEILRNPVYNAALDFNFREDNLAGYVEIKKGFGKKVSVGAGLRAENFTLNPESTASQSMKKNYFNFFPSFNAIYRITPDINFIATYSRKISIPSYSQFDPNNSGYYDSYNTEVGNMMLKPNFYNNIEVKFSVLEYLQLSANYAHSQSLNLSELSVQPNSLQTVQTFKTYSNVSSMTYFFSVPVPFGIFREGLKYLNSEINIDKINFLYLYTSRTKTNIDNFNYVYPNKAFWYHGVYSQFILPWGIKMNVDYNIRMKGMYQMYDFTKISSSLDVVFTKDFLNKKLKASLSFDDIFNQSQSTVRTSFPNLYLENYNKEDTRIIWMKLSYSFGKYEKPSSNDLDLNKGGQNPNDGLLK